MSFLPSLIPICSFYVPELGSKSSAMEGIGASSVRFEGLEPVGALDRAFEHLWHHGVAARLAGLVGQQVLLRDVGDIGGAVVLGQQVIERLVLVGPDLFRDG